jgi:hypothetical protein
MSPISRAESRWFALYALYFAAAWALERALAALTRSVSTPARD